MSITRGVLAQSPEPEAHDKVLDNNPDRIGIWKFWFLRRGENRSTRRKTSQSKDENQQQTQPTYDAESGNRTRATLVGGLRGRQMLNHCAIPAPQKASKQETLLQPQEEDIKRLSKEEQTSVFFFWRYFPLTMTKLENVRITFSSCSPYLTVSSLANDNNK